VITFYFLRKNEGYFGAGLWRESYLPIRSLQIKEAAALLGNGEKSKDGVFHGAVILGLRNEVVEVATTYYLSPTEDCKDQSSHESQLPQLLCTDKYSYYMIPASGGGWDKRVYSLYHLDRRILEKELGRNLSDNDIDLDYFKDAVPSFSDARIPFYVIIETLYLCLIISTLLYVFRKNAWFFFPTLLAFQGITILFVPFYSPAFYDYDFFFQRVILEDLWMVAMLAIPVTGVLAAASLAAYLVKKTWKKQSAI
jgi:hypothetical protein